MLGALIGDIAGSRFEGRRNNIKTKDFDFLDLRRSQGSHCRFTDDSVMTMAVAKALMKADGQWATLNDLAEKHMRRIGRLYPHCGYGGKFEQWIFSDDMGPYGSFGNGSAMRVSACSFVAQSLDEVKLLSRKVTQVTHNHLEGLKGAEAVAVCGFLARTGKSIEEICEHMDAFYYPMDFVLNDIRDTYEFDVTCQGSVPQAIMAFLESTSFEDAIRNAISIGGDSDTIAAMTGGIADAFYGIPPDIRKNALTFLDDCLRDILFDFEKAFPDSNRITKPA